MAQTQFPPNFVWGAATAAYQIEGAVNEDGRGPSIWDTFSHTPGKTDNGDTGDVACDHYHRWREDVHLMQELGLQGYRLSIAWPRVIPQGRGQVNQRSLDFYDGLVDALLEANITPFVTLYHWDLPQALQDQGGWANRDTVDAFTEYTEVVARRLGDRVQHWITHNEPWVVSFVGNYQGRHAPGIQGLPTALEVSHHLLLSHGRAVPILRANSANAQVGITLNLAPAHAATDAPEDEMAAQRADGYQNRWFLDPVFGRGYPADMLELYGDRFPSVSADDLQEIAAPIDFVGINYYFPVFVRATATGADPLGFTQLGRDELGARGYETTEMGWPMVPDGLNQLLTRVHHDYAPPAIYITENGAAFPDQVVNNSVDDPRRVAYLHDHFRAAREAIDAGVPLRGYFVWSLMDNFEWGFGYSKRFGIIYVDYPTQTRISKTSARWYQRVIAANTVVGADER